MKEQLHLLIAVNSRYTRMPKLNDPSGEADEYELRPTTSSHDREADAEPLLPRYTADPSEGPSIKLVDKPGTRTRSSANVRRTIQCLGIGLLLALLGFGLAGCLFGKRSLDSVRGWEKWEQVPPEWREWLDSVIPPERQHADHGAFPTE